MIKIKEKVLRYKSDHNTLTTSPIEIISIDEIIKEKIDNVYLLPITDTQYQLVLYNGKIYYIIGITVFNWQLEEKEIKDSVIAKIKEYKQIFSSGFEEYIKDQMEKCNYITKLEIELLYQFNLFELGNKAKKYIVEWKAKQEQKEKEEEKRQQEERQQEEQEEKEKRIDEKHQKYYFVMQYIKDKTALQQGKIFQQLIENAKYYKVDGKIISFYDMVEIFITTTIVEVEEYQQYKKQKGEIKSTSKKELVYFPNGKGSESYTINKTQYDYIEWRLNQVNN